MPEWIWHWSGYAVAVVAFVGVVWALFWDRPRGRKRCRRCWYDLSGAADLPADCPECGRAHAKPKHLTRTRRRWGRAAVLGLLMVVGGYGLWVVPRVQERGTWGLVPTTATIVAMPWMRGDADVERQLEAGRVNNPYSQSTGTSMPNMALVSDEQSRRISRFASIKLTRFESPRFQNSLQFEAFARIDRYEPWQRRMARRWWDWSIRHDLAATPYRKRHTDSLVYDANFWLGTYRP